MRKTWIVALAGTLLLAGCGSDSKNNADNTPAPGATTQSADHTHDGGGGTCSPKGTTVSVTASNIAFDATCLAAPAGKQFTLTFENKDNVPHSVAILESHTATTFLFHTDTYPGPKTMTYTFGPLKAGTYHFHCEVHPDQMNGTFIVA
jgi:plastocyanin